MNKQDPEPSDMLGSFLAVWMSLTEPLQQVFRSPLYTAYLLDSQQAFLKLLSYWQVNADEYESIVADWRESFSTCISQSNLDGLSVAELSENIAEIQVLLESSVVELIKRTKALNQQERQLLLLNTSHFFTFARLQHEFLCSAAQPIDSNFISALLDGVNDVKAAFGAQNQQHDSAEKVEKYSEQKGSINSAESLPINIGEAEKIYEAELYSLYRILPSEPQEEGADSSGYSASVPTLWVAQLGTDGRKFLNDTELSGNCLGESEFYLLSWKNIDDLASDSDKAMRLEGAELDAKTDAENHRLDSLDKNTAGFDRYLDSCLEAMERVCDCSEQVALDLAGHSSGGLLAALSAAYLGQRSESVGVSQKNDAREHCAENLKPNHPKAKSASADSSSAMLINSLSLFSTRLDYQTQEGLSALSGENILALIKQQSLCNSTYSPAILSFADKLLRTDGLFVQDYLRSCSPTNTQLSNDFDDSFGFAGKVSQFASKIVELNVDRTISAKLAYDYLSAFYRDNCLAGNNSGGYHYAATTSPPSGESGCFLTLDHIRCPIYVLFFDSEEAEQQKPVFARAGLLSAKSRYVVASVDATDDSSADTAGDGSVCSVDKKLKLFTKQDAETVNAKDTECFLAINVYDAKHNNGSVDRDSPLSMSESAEAPDLVKTSCIPITDDWRAWLSS